MGQWAYYSTGALALDEQGAWATPTAWEAGVAHWYVIPSSQGPVGTVGWEARREGVEDYRILRALQRLASGGSGKAADGADALLAQIRRLAPEEAFAERPGDLSYLFEWDPMPDLTCSEWHRARERTLDLIAELQRP